MAAEKQAIRAAFSQAAASYDAVAEVQRRIAHTLMQHTPAATRILDAGCGTGFGARQLRAAQPEACIFTLDAAQAMCVRAGELTSCGDIEMLPLADASIDLYWSSLAWQWTQALPASREAARVLQPGGALRVATLGPATLHELRSAFAGIDAHPHVRDFHSAQTHADALAACGFQDIEITEYTERSFAPELSTLLRDIRSLGAHQLGAQRRRGLLGRSAWQHLQNAYESQRESAGLPTSYAVILLSARKP